MLIGLEHCNIRPKVCIVEPHINREASQYIVENYRNLLGIIRHYDIKEEKAEDLLHDLFISIVDSEDNGEGFDMEYCGTDKDDVPQLMSVEQFVFGRAKLYSNNVKYRTDIVDGYNSSVVETHEYLDSVLDENGQEIIDKNGKVKTVKRVEKVRKQTLVTVNAASFDDGNASEDTNDDFQKAFAKASVSDTTEDITELMSLREQIDYCIDICELNGIKLLNIFRNIDAIADMLGDVSKKKKTSESLFAPLTELVKYHDEFGKTLMEVLRFSASHRSEFDSVIATYA